MSVSGRIRIFIASKGIHVSDFERICGLSNGAVSKMGNGTRRSTIDKISTAFPDLNKYWLMTGEGDMLKSRKSQVVHGNNNIVQVTSGGNNTNITSRNNDNSAEIAVLREQVKHLTELLGEKERLIKLYERMIDAK